MARGSNRRIGWAKKARKRSGLTIIDRKSRSATSGRYVVIGPRGGKTSRAGSGTKRRVLQPEPRGPLFRSGDPTLAKRAEEELHSNVR